MPANWYSFAYGPSSELGLTIGAGGILIAALAIAFALLYAPGPPGYTLTPDSLSIHDRFYPVTLRADAVDMDQMGIVDLDQDSQWLPRRKTNGFSNAHYHAGWFRVRNGQKIRLYRADGRKLVLLPSRGEGDAVLYEAPDPERFLAELRREWAGHP